MNNSCLLPEIARKHFKKEDLKLDFLKFLKNYLEVGRSRDCLSENTYKDLESNPEDILNFLDLLYQDLTGDEIHEKFKKLGKEKEALLSVFCERKIVPFVPLPISPFTKKQDLIVELEKFGIIFKEHKLVGSYTVDIAISEIFKTKLTLSPFREELTACEVAELSTKIFGMWHQCYEIVKDR